MKRHLIYASLLTGLCLVLAAVALSLSGCSTLANLNIVNPSYSLRDIRPHVAIALPLSASSIDLDRSYMWTMEYDMYEFDLGNTFNYAEMAYLIAPRPFMVERGHDDGVGTDEMVAYEYARVRYLYANRLKIGDRTEIEFFPGGHMIHGKGTFAFLAKHCPP